MRRLTTITLALAALACDTEDHPADDPAPARAGAPAEQPPHVRRAAPEHTGDVQVMPNAEAAFAEVLQLIDEKYLDPDVSADALYTGAAEGALSRLYQVGDHPVNALLNPRELEELTHDTSGSIVGVGVQISHTAGVIVVIHVIPGGPAEAAGIRAGDRILAIDGARTHDLSLPAVVDRIRGAAGTDVDLFVQRDTEEWHARLKRASVTLMNVGPGTLDDGVAVLPIRGFAENTPAELDAAIAELQARGMKALILDLRDCPGGLLDAATAVAGRFLAKGQAIAAVAARAGEPRQFTAEVDGPYRELPLAVLVGPRTTSGAEVVADALQHHGRATLVGQDTLGKDSVEHVHKLANGWGLKLTSGRLLGADGKPRAGKGVHPRLPAPVADDAPAAATPGDDAALELARAWLQGRGG